MSSVYSSCTVKCYGGMMELHTAAKKVAIVYMSMCVYCTVYTSGCISYRCLCMCIVQYIALGVYHIDVYVCCTVYTSEGVYHIVVYVYILYSVHL